MAYTHDKPRRYRRQLELQEIKKKSDLTDKHKKPQASAAVRQFTAAM